ncbi:hypothetical protein GJ744_000925 [Endocarpon pusillum]|uniref:Alcohol dehydrogenase-like N-terminal domain-containing protein n=1 Tax=Endocarpon pusillum TaxID=364733 RepID=A0A8H7E6X6_9EURO|nr:hypothetical protein GJ744_000925 [Endocarpon pusillum]
MVTGQYRPSCPLAGGHEGAGIVIARGELVDDDVCKIGEAVGVTWLNGSCLACDFCQQAGEPLCLKPTLSGYSVDGTFQQYCMGKTMGLQAIAIDSGDEKKMREDMGATSFIHFAKTKNINEDVRKATRDGIGPHAAILVGVNEKPFQQAAEYDRPRGCVVVIGLRSSL